MLTCLMCGDHRLPERDYCEPCAMDLRDAGRTVEYLLLRLATRIEQLEEFIAKLELKR